MHRIYETLKDENAKILLTLGKLETTRNGEAPELLAELRSRIDTRDRMEEELLYPLLAAHPDAESLVQRSRAENQRIHQALDRMARTNGAKAKLREQAQQLAREEREHIEHEEAELFRLASRLIPQEQAEALAERARRDLEEV